MAPGRCFVSKLIYGPVPSRRFGLSLGVDVVPFKACTLDCVYCQLGPTSMLTVERRSFVPREQVVEEVVAAVERGPRPDVITFAGSGEPTLYLDLGWVAAELRNRLGIRLNLITNGTLLWREDVAADAAFFDVVAPDLDAADPTTFFQVNRPHPSLDVEQVLDGIARFAASNPGKVRLEVFLVPGINDSTQALDGIIKAAARIAPAVVELNTAVRPTPGRNVAGVGAEELARIALLFDPPAIPVAPFESRGSAPEPVPRIGEAPAPLTERILATLKRRPCTAGQLGVSLAVPVDDIQVAVQELLARGLVRVEGRDGELYLLA